MTGARVAIRPETQRQKGGHGLDHISVVIGHGEPDGSPMADSRLQVFQQDVCTALQAACPDGGWLEQYRGTTVWEGQDEACTVIAVMGAADLASLPTLRAELSKLAALYGQSAISLRYGTAELITPDQS